jgi:tRNA(Ile)-lysidine synthase
MAESHGRVGKEYGGPGFDVLERTEKTIVSRGMFEPEDRVVVAVSGGPDSMCLLDVLARLEDRMGLELLIAHVDHGLSEESERVAAHVAGYGSTLGYEVHLARAHDLEGPNLHERARQFRYAFFEDLAAREGARRVATAHTLDDRVETTLARLIHGAGLAGVAGIQPIEGVRVRPLIASRRDETRTYCTEVGIDFYDDPANLDERFERPRVRKRVVAAIEDGWGDGAVRAVATSAERLSEDAAALRALADRLARDVITSDDEGATVHMATEALTAMPRALRRRVLEVAVGRVRDRSGGIDAALDALDDPSGGPRRFALAGGREIVVDRNETLVARMPR